MPRLISIVFGVVFLAFLIQPIHGEQQASLTQIKRSLTCTCACAMTVDACEGAMTCGEASKLAAEATQMIGRGLDEDDILANFVSTYGEQILAAPTKRGFNLLAWILPFALTILGGFGVTHILRRWASMPQKSLSGGRRKATTQTGHDEYATRLDDILRGLD